MRVADLLVARLRREFPQLRIPEGARIARTYASRSQKESGAFSWFMLPNIGGCETMTATLDAARLEIRHTPWNDIDICIVEE